MTIHEAVARYLALLVTQLEHDVVYLTDWKLIGTVVPFVLYVIYFFFKWYCLLAPVTVPMTLWSVLRGEAQARGGKPLWKN